MKKIMTRSELSLNILTHKIVRDDETLGYKVNTGEKSYSISSSGLISKELFMLLINNGYSYFGRMEFEDSSKNNIEDLPEIPFDSLSDIERSEFFETKDVMTKDELEEHINKRSDEPAFSWKTPDKFLINTRQELLDFIKAPIKFDHNDPRTYMPINAFTNPEALFSEVEFLDPANYSLMDRIANKRYYNLYSLFKMNEELPVAGFDPIDFIDAYFAWGIDGLKTKVISKSVVEIDKPLYVRDNFPLEGFTNTGLAYVKNDLSLTPELKPGWSVGIGDEGIRKVSANLPTAGHGFLVSTKSPATIKCIKYMFKNFTVEITPDAMKFKMPKGEFIVKTIRFLMPSKQYLPSSLWNLKLDENKEEIMHRLKIESMAKHLAGALKCKTDATSIKVYKTLGLTTPRAVDTVLNVYRDILFNKDGSMREEYSKAIIEGNSDAFEEDELSALSLQIGMIKDVYTYEEAAPENLEILHNLCKKVENGEINIDNVLNGIKADNSVRLDDIIKHLDAAVKILGLSYDEIYDIIERDADNVSGDGIVTFTFEGNGVIDDFHIPRQNFTLTGFQKDLRSELSRLAWGAKHWLYINEIYTEPGQACARHIAVRMFTWPHYLADRKESFVRSIEEQIIEQINPQLQQHGVDIGDDIIQLVARSLCEFGLLGKTQTSIKIREGAYIDVAVTPGIRQQIRDTFERKFETTFNISNFMFKSGEPMLYCVNAIVTPYWVVPLGKQPIVTYPLYLAWHFGKEENARKPYEEMKAKGYMPSSSNNYSLKYLQSNFIEESRLMTESYEGLSLSDYCYENFTEPGNVKYKPLHPMDKYYSMLSRAEDEYLSGDDFSNGLKHKMLYYSSFCNSDDSKKIIDISSLDYSGELYDLLVGGRENIVENAPIKLFSGFIDKDLLAMDDLDSFKKVFCADMGSIYLRAHENNRLLFTDGTVVNYFEVPMVEKNQYAVRQINDRLYLIYYESGRVLRVDI